MNLMKLVSRFNRFRRNYFFDRRYGAFIGGVKKTPFASQGSTDTANVSYEELRYLFLRDVVRPSDVLVDVGCGKGRVLNWWLDRYPGHRIYGLELDAEVAAQVAARLADYPVSIVTGDARETAPDDGTLYFMFNPFNAEIMADVVEMLKKKAANLPSGAARPLRVVYHNCLHLHLFEYDPECRVTPIPMPSRFGLRAALIEI
jgi:SAM-dependent methyltransferase